MENIHSKFLTADTILSEYSKKEDKFSERFSALSKEINYFIEKMHFEDKVKLNELALGYTLVDYFEDVHRLKVFHKLEHINGIKIVSYTSFWLLKRKPIQIIKCEKELLDINERFVLNYILSFLSNKDKKHIVLRDNVGLKSFTETLLYFLKYRLTTANNIEMIIMAFFAGQIYQEENEDISPKLGKMDK